MKNLVGIDFVMMLLALATILMTTPVNAQQAGDVYWGLSGAPSRTLNNEAGDDKVKFDIGFAAAAQIGLVFDTLRAEGELQYSRNDVDKIGGSRSNADLQTYRATASLFYDCKERDRLFSWEPYWGGISCNTGDFIPYGGLGLGVAYQRLDGDLNDEKTGLTIHAEAGVSFISARRLELIAALRSELFEGKLDDLDDRVFTYQLRLGLRFYY